MKNKIMKQLYGKKKLTTKLTARERFDKAIENIESIEGQIKALYKKQQLFYEVERLAMLDVFEEEALLVGTWQVEPRGLEGLALVANRKCFEKLTSFLIADAYLEHITFSLTSNNDYPSINVRIDPENINIEFDEGSDVVAFVNRFNLKIKSTFLRKYLKECQDKVQSVMGLLANFPEK